MASAIAQQVQAVSPDQPISYPRTTVDYIPKAHSKLPFNYAPVSWDMVDSDLYRHLSGEAVKLYVYLSRISGDQISSPVPRSGDLYW